MTRTTGPSLAVRGAALFLAASFVAGCSGTNRLLPASPAGLSAGASVRDVQPDGRDVETMVRIRIPHGGNRSERRPATISPMTKSVSIGVNGAAPQKFNATTASPGCKAGTQGTTCTFAVQAKTGTDDFTVTTYSGLNATGTALDRGFVPNVKVVAGKANRIAVTLGPVVTTTADGGTGSLRYAIASASAGDTIMFLLAKGATITTATPIVVTGHVTVAGPGAATLTISGSGAHQIFQSIGTLTVSGVTLKAGKAATPSNPGGAIQNMGALTLINDVVTSSTSLVSAVRRVRGKGRALKIRGLHPHCTTTDAEGGAIYNDGALTTSGTTFSNNVVKSNPTACLVGQGGAIFNDLEGTLSSTNDTYSGNSAATGGAVYNAAIGAATFTGDHFNGNLGCTAASGCPTSGCGATSCTTAATGEGAAIYDAGAGITVVSSTFTGNVAGGKTAGAIGEGGALFLDSPLPSVTKSTFTSNLAGGGTASCSTGEGGAIFAANPIELNNDTFKTNAAIGDATGVGGAVVGAMDINGTGDTFTGNSAVGSGGACTSSGTAIGGAVVSASATITLSNSTFTGNSVSANEEAAGGAVAGDTGVITNCTFTSNSATGTGGNTSTSTTGAGGAALFGTIGKVTGNTFTSNKATAESSVAEASIGGAVAVESGTLLSNGNTYTSNASVDKAAVGTAAGGAAVGVSGSFVSTGDKFSSNSATGGTTAGGGAVFAEGGLIMSDGILTSNKATGPLGVGGAMAIGNTSQLTHVTITANTATGTTTGEGGGIYDAGGATINNSTISQNSATSAGGGTSSQTSPEVIVESTIDGNSVTKANVAAAGGGGIFEADGVELAYSTVAGNKVTISGPGPSGGGGIVNNGGIIMIDTTISGNSVLGSAPQSGGGAILSGSTILGLNSTISNNTSSVDAGGLYNVGTGVTFSNATFFHNSATGKGGNIENLAAGSLELTNSVVGGGTAATGHDIDNLGAISSGDYNIIQTVPAGNAITGTTTHDVTADPKLLPLSNNGGLTFTNADQATSPGKSHIPFASSKCGSISITTDQRGYTRGTGGHCDSGAYEYLGVATAVAQHPVLPKRSLRPDGAHRGLMPRLRRFKLPRLVP